MNLLCDFVSQLDLNNDKKNNIKQFKNIFKKKIKYLTKMILQENKMDQHIFISENSVFYKAIKRNTKNQFKDNALIKYYEKKLIKYLKYDI